MEGSSAIWESISGTCCLASPLFFINYISCVPQQVPPEYLTNKQTGNTVLLVMRKEMVENSAQSHWATGKINCWNTATLSLPDRIFNQSCPSPTATIKHCTNWRRSLFHLVLNRDLQTRWTISPIKWIILAVFRNIWSLTDVVYIADVIVFTNLSSALVFLS